MYFNRVSAKQEARRLIREASPSPVKVTLIYLLLTSGVTYLVGLFANNPFRDSLQYILEGYDPMQVYAYVLGGGSVAMALFLNILMAFYQTVMGFGYNNYCLRTCRYQDGEVRDLFEGFGMAVKVISLQLFIAVFVALWSMLFLIPGIIAAFSYSQALYCLLDDPEIGPLEAIRRSKILMRGEKMNYFVLELSFLGWILLAEAIVMLVSTLAAGSLALSAPAVSQGITAVILVAVNLWLMPYMNLVYAQFYDTLVKRQKQGSQGPRIEF